jgi:hypothetical protein
VFAFFFVTLLCTHKESKTIAFFFVTILCTHKESKTFAFFFVTLFVLTKQSKLSFHKEGKYYIQKATFLIQQTISQEMLL